MNGIINEDSPLTFAGSFTRDLLFSKFWLCRELTRLPESSHINEIVVLGSWYGNIGLIIMQYGIPFGRMVLVDHDDGCNRVARAMFNRDSRVRVLTADANDLSYTGNPSSTLVINTSCNDMDQHEWYASIPAGTLTALQSRSDREDHREFSLRYPMGRVLYSGAREYHDPTETYHRYTRIGIR